MTQMAPAETAPQDKAIPGFGLSATSCSHVETFSHWDTDVSLTLKMMVETNQTRTAMRPSKRKEEVFQVQLQSIRLDPVLFLGLWTRKEKLWGKRTYNPQGGCCMEKKERQPILDTSLYITQVEAFGTDVSSIKRNIGAPWSSLNFAGASWSRHGPKLAPKNTSSEPRNCSRSDNHQTLQVKFVQKARRENGLHQLFILILALQTSQGYNSFPIQRGNFNLKGQLDYQRLSIHSFSNHGFCHLRLWTTRWKITRTRMIRSSMQLILPTNIQWIPSMSKFLLKRS